MGRSSPRTVTPSTRGTLPTAKAPSLWKYGVQRVVGEQRTQRTRKLSTRDVSWRPAPWKTTRVNSCGGRRNGNRGCMVAPWRSTKGAEPCAVKAARTVLNGGDGETGRKALRPVPTQPGHWARLTAGVRCQGRSGPPRQPDCDVPSGLHLHGGRLGLRGSARSRPPLRARARRPGDAPPSRR